MSATTCLHQLLLLTTQCRTRPSSFLSEEEKCFLCCKGCCRRSQPSVCSLSLSWSLSVDHQGAFNAFNDITIPEYLFVTMSFMKVRHTQDTHVRTCNAMVQDTTELRNCSSQLPHHHFDLVRITNRDGGFSPSAAGLGELLTQCGASSFDQENNSHCIDNTHTTLEECRLELEWRVLHLNTEEE